MHNRKSGIQILFNHMPSSPEANKDINLHVIDGFSGNQIFSIIAAREDPDEVIEANNRLVRGFGTQGNDTGHHARGSVLDNRVGAERPVKVSPDSEFQVKPPKAKQVLPAQSPATQTGQTGSPDQLIHLENADELLDLIEHYHPNDLTIKGIADEYLT
jgi:hypothetical protein